MGGAAEIQQLQQLQQHLLAWWELHGRLDPAQKPWMVAADGRWPEPGQELDCWPIWVAEVMLQQTRLSVVLPYWQAWM